MKNSQNARTPNRVVDFFSDWRRALAVAGILHLLVTLSVFLAGRLGIFSQQFDRDGIGHLALDGYVYRMQADSLAETLWHGGVLAWLRTRAEFHVRLYSLDFAVLRPLAGANILTAEPLNLFYYLAILILTFKLAKRVAGKQVAWLASAIVALWPSLLLHTTQFLRDPLFIAAMLGLVLVLTNFLTKVYTWARSLAAVIMALSVSLVLSMTRNEMWPVVRTTIFFALGLFVIRMLCQRKLRTANLAGIALL